MVDSMAPPMRVGPDVVQAIEDHVHSDIDREVGGILVGTRGGDVVAVEAAIPALKAVGERANVTFTHDVWDDVHARIEREYPGKDIVGWYHSHPGFGIFLSGYDRFIHENFFSDPAMIALVVDPLAGQLGWFGWVGGQIELLEEGPSRKAETSAVATSTVIREHRNRRGTTLLVGGALLAASLGVGFWLGSGSGTATEARTDPTSTSVHDSDGLATELQQVTAERDELAASEVRLQRALRELRPTAQGRPVLIQYVVQPGDSLWRISAALHGSGFGYVSIRQINPDAGDGIDPGDVLLIEVRPSRHR
jgi:proteasome lid subunit RPN8/RPN11